MENYPPLLCRRLFQAFVPEYDWKYFFCGIDEVYQGVCQSHGKFRADVWYWAQLLKSLPRFLTNTIGGHAVMFKNMIITGLRNIKRHKGYTAINLTGLAVGLAVCILLFLWVQDELSYDRFHTDADRIYRVIEHEEMSNGEVLSFTQQSPELAPILKAEYPEILEAVRYIRRRNYLVRFEDHQYYEQGFAFCDPEFLSIFTFPLKSGKADASLSDPSAILITDKVANKYFGNQDPIGKILQVENHSEFVVSGVLENLPSNSHLQFDFLVRFENIENFGSSISGWRSFYLDTYVLLSENTDYKALNPKIRNVIDEHTDGSAIYIDLQPLTDIRLFSNKILVVQGDGDFKYIVIFSLVAIFILLNACINFMNLTTARSDQRAREIAMRKVVGARRKELIRQFFGESLLMAFISLIFSLGLVFLLLPYFNQLSGKNLPISSLAQPHVVFSLLGITIIAGLISGIYPALFLSSFQPVSVFKGSKNSILRGGSFRRILVIFQFVMTSVLIIGTVVMYRQLHFLRTQNLGYAKDQVMCIRLQGRLRNKLELLKTSFEHNTGVLNTAAASTIPGNRRATLTLEDWEGRDSEDRFELGLMDVDDGFLATLGLEMKEGRFFSKEFSTDENALVINEAAVRALGMKDPIGKWLLDPELKIIGVIKDFNLRSLHHNVAPLAMTPRPARLGHMFVKIKAENIPETIAALESTWRSVVPEYPFEFQFLDEHLEKLYSADKRIGKIINTFTGLALFVACLGLFGLASFVAERRTKEIGIRKVLGASNPVIFFLLAKDFLKWIMIAYLIAGPMAAYASLKYLNLYAYHTDLGPVIFLIPGMMILSVALLTVSWQALKAATTDPVHSLRYE
jgi:ABC-type antimicrobial peptide transport system permease subunit